MPGGDRTGPLGMGPMTGRGAGLCNSYRADSGFYPGGFGRGRGFRRMFQATGQPGWRRFGYDASYQGASEVPFDEKDLLTRQKESLQEQLNILEKKLERLNDER